MTFRPYWIKQTKRHYLIFQDVEKIPQAFKQSARSGEKAAMKFIHTVLPISPHLYMIFPHSPALIFVILLIDESPAVTIERSIEEVAGTFMVKDIPIGKYSVKALYPGKTLLLDYRNNNGTPEICETVVFGKYGYLAATDYNIGFWISE